jgi:hypothetical protein
MRLCETIQQVFVCSWKHLLHWAHDSSLGYLSLAVKLEVRVEADGRDCHASVVVLEAVFKRAARRRCRGDICARKPDARAGGTTINMGIEARNRHP